MATISRAAIGRPEFGARHDNNKRRFLVGWRHQNDTEQGLKTGKIWGWVSEPPEKFQVFDEEFNRSDTAGEVRFCGVANFTMVRMFHPYWALDGQVPRDGEIEDKRRCREKGRQLTRQYRIELGLPVEDDDSPAEDVIVTSVSKKGKSSKKTKKEQRRQVSRSPSGEREVRGPRTLENMSRWGTEERLAGGSIDEPMFVSDDEEDDTKPDPDPIDEFRFILWRLQGAGTKSEPLDID